MKPRSLPDFLEELGSEKPVPAGGSAAAAAVAMAAGLVEKAARLSRAHLIDAPRFIKQAGSLRQAASICVEQDARAYSEYMEALRAARGRNAEAREQILRKPRNAIVDVPLKVARYAAQVADMGSELARHGNPNLRSDAYVAVQLAAAAARSAAATLAQNVRTSGHDAKLAEVRRLAAAASASARRPPSPAPGGGRGRARAQSRDSGRS